MKRHYYIVVYWDYMGRINHFGELGSENILWNGNPTLFDTYEAARNAIKRTITYGKRNNLSWDKYTYARIKKAVR